LGREIIDTCEYIVEALLHKNFKVRTERAIPKDERVANEITIHIFLHLILAFARMVMELKASAD